jgi:starch phosphorylase
VAAVVNHDPVMRDRLKVVFLPNYSVSLAERIIPATDLSEQISTAGYEASGTGNMKFAMNGALTIGTYDGANIEIREAVGPENFFLFGLRDEQVKELKAGGYAPAARIARSPILADVIDLLEEGFFSPDDPGRFRRIVDELRNRDTYLHCADFDAYLESQAEVERVYRDSDEWTARVVRNIAQVGRFSSDRTIREYAEQIWRIRPVRVTL